MNHDIKTALLTELRDRPGAEAERLLRRLELQTKFARAFLHALPASNTAGWGAQIAEAERIADSLSPSAGLDGLSNAVSAAEAAMTGIGQAAKNYTVHCVGHGHIDMNWMWSWPETVATTHDTFASVLRLMDEYPQFTYSQSQAAVYALTERYFPKMFKAIQARVREGRWEVTAAHWVEGDKNIVSGESLCRHLLATRAYFQEKFGLLPEDQPVDWEPDTFGHPVTLPGILTQGAVKFYYSCRPGGGYHHPRIGGPRPPLFWWQGPDGARILVNREITWYNSDLFGDGEVGVPLAEFVQKTGLRDWLNVYGIGNHGGGPTRLELDFLHECQTYPIYPRVVFSTVKAYFEAVEKTLAGLAPDAIPTLTHELNFEFTGCYTSQSLLKQANRFGENYLEEAETLALLASRLTGEPYPQKLLQEAWRAVLFNQFHDILPGSGVRQTRERAMAAFQEVGAITGSIKRTSTQALFADLNTAALLPDTPAGCAERAGLESGGANASFEAGAGLGAGETGLSSSRGGGRRFRPFVIYNPCAWPRSERVVVDLYDSGFDPYRIVALDEQGHALPTLLLEDTGAGWVWAHRRIKVAFSAEEVPALGYRTFLLCEGTADTLPETVAAGDQHWFETPALRFRLDRSRSGLHGLWDRRTGARLSVAEGLLGSWALVTERPGEMTSWILGEEVDAPLALLSSSFEVAGRGRSGITGLPEGGPPDGCRAAWRLAVPGTSSSVRVSLMIHALEPRLDFEAEVDWREIGDSARGIPGLTVRFPLALFGVSSRYEAPFGSVERALTHGEEVPSLRYAHLFGTARTDEGTEVPAGITLLQDCKHGHALTADSDGCELRLRIVRSSFDPDPTPEVAVHTVRFSLVLHNAPVDPAALARLGADRNHPLIVLPVDLQTGETPPSRSFARVLTPGVVLSALKQVEDGEGLVLRLVEMNGRDTEAVMELGPALLAGLTTTTPLDLMERPIGDGIALNGTTLTVPIRAGSFATFSLT